MKKKFIYIIVFFFSALTNQLTAQSFNTYKENSVLAQGKWVKLSVQESGVHKIPYTMLTSWGFANPSKVSVYGFGGQLVPPQNDIERPDDLPEVAVWHHDNALFFYAQGAVNWEWDGFNFFFNHKLHTYSQKAFYFITETAAPKKMSFETTPTGTITNNVSEYDYLTFHENNNLNILPLDKRSGRKMYGEQFSTIGRLERNFQFNLPNLITNKPIKVAIAAVARSSNNSKIELHNSTNSEKILELNIISVNLNNLVSYYARENKTYGQFKNNTSLVDLKIAYTNALASSTAWLDYITLNARAQLKLDNHQLIFRDSESVLIGGTTQFKIDNTTSSTEVWDVTNIITPKRIETSKANKQLTFVSDASELKTFVAFNYNAALPIPEKVKDLPNQNLHAAKNFDYVIVSPQEFMPYAEELADLHRTHSQSNPIIVTPEQIYNEYSWGHMDPTAIRSFVRMLYDRANGDASKQPKHLLLFGNGYYNNTTSTDLTGHTWIPTYQSENSIHQSESYVTDDYFGFLEPNQGYNDSGDKVKIGIGRFPVRTTRDAQIAVNKVKNYLESQLSGSWRQKIAFIADDEDRNIHISDSEKLTIQVRESYPEFEIEKIYLDNYTKTTSSMGERFPDAQKAVERTIDNGVLLVNFVGHGGVEGLTHEQVITRSTIQNWKNHNRLPLFVTATCEFSRFDDPVTVSSGEEVFLNPNGGGIALFSTTRLVYSSYNYLLNRAFFAYVFEPDSESKRATFGDIIKNTKNSTIASINKLNFALLGDPALKLIYPENRVKTTKINSAPISEVADTLKALSIASVEAEIIDNEGNLLADFNGTADVIIFDKSQTIKTKGNKGQEPFEFTQYPNVLFKGKAKVTDGKLNLQFMVPFDIKYNFDFGRISYYAVSNENREAMGSFSNFIVGGFNPQAQADNEGPEISLYLNHEKFKDGDKTGSQPILYATLSDISGINTTGSGIGHDVTLIINDDNQNPIILNEYYQAHEGTYRSGQIIYQLPPLPEGVHEIQLKAWDNFNNSSDITTSFNVSTDKELPIANFTFSPNPIKLHESGTIAFETFEGNSVIDINITALTLTGQTVGSLNTQKVASNNNIQPFNVSLASLGINKSGFYILKLQIKSSTGKSKQIAQKIMVLP